MTVDWLVGTLASSRWKSSADGLLFSARASPLMPTTRGQLSECCQQRSFLLPVCQMGLSLCQFRLDMVTFPSPFHTHMLSSCSFFSVQTMMGGGEEGIMPGERAKYLFTLFVYPSIFFFSFFPSSYLYVCLSILDYLFIFLSSFLPNLPSIHHLFFFLFVFSKCLSIH